MNDSEQEPGLAGEGGARGPSLDDAELIAALIDRRLSSQERRELLARLDLEEALYEVFVEILRQRE